MKIELWQIGKTSFDFLETGIDLYSRRIKRYLPFEILTIPDIKNTKNLNFEQIKEKEGNLVLKKLHPNDLLIILDEKGKLYTSEKFATQLDQWLQRSNRKIIFLIGGAYGFHQTIYQRANVKLSLSQMTFSHQMVRLFFTEQFYRALTILKNEPYHHR